MAGTVFERGKEVLIAFENDLLIRMPIQCYLWGQFIAEAASSGQSGPSYA
jgi:hypothetical protein